MDSISGLNGAEGMKNWGFQDLSLTPWDFSFIARQFAN